MYVEIGGFFVVEEQVDVTSQLTKMRAGELCYNQSEVWQNQMS